MRRVYLQADPFADNTQPYYLRGKWPAAWIDHPARPLSTTSVALFRRRFTLDKAATLRLHVSADNRYRLFIDGAKIGSGPERGDPLHWRFETYEISLDAGEHILTALSWWLDDNHAPAAQMTIRPGFLLAAEAAWQTTISTGIAPWEVALVHGIEFLPKAGVAWSGTKIIGDEYPWGWETGRVGDWAPAVKVWEGMAAALKIIVYRPFWLLTPATLPPMLEQPRVGGTVRHLVAGAEPCAVNSHAHLSDEAPAWQSWLTGQSRLTIPAGIVRRAIIDLGDYVCAYPELCVSGGKGAYIRVQWAESLFVDEQNKGHRDEIEGKCFRGYGDEFLPDGGDQRVFSALWWSSGRYVEITVKTADEPLTLESLVFIETRYPLEMEGKFRCSDPRLESVIPIGRRALQMCSHDIYMDCPYYEQLMYVGDTRLETLVTYVLTGDDRLPRKALQCFDDSRRLNGLTQARYPSPLVQIIPPFSLWWVSMVHDYWLWRDDMEFVRGLLPGVRAVMEYFHSLIDADGLMGPPNGWNFTDWVPAWEHGIPPGAEALPSSILNLQCVLVLRAKAEMEDFFGAPDLARRDQAAAARMVKAVLRRFWSRQRHMLADDEACSQFSEHAQCLAILTGLLPVTKAKQVADALLHESGLSPTTIYFSHYLFEALYRLGQSKMFFNRLSLWFDLERLGFKTTLEKPEPSRSDCHAWGAHPIYHYYASVLGIRPVAAGFRQVRIAPLPGDLKQVEGVLPHPAGRISVKLSQVGRQLRVRVSLPRGVAGVFVWQGRKRQLGPGVAEFKA